MRVLTEKVVKGILEKYQGKNKEYVRIPPERNLAVSYGVSRVTIRRALDKIHGDGMLERRGRYGTYLISKNVVESNAVAMDERWGFSVENLGVLSKKCKDVTIEFACHSLARAQIYPQVKDFWNNIISMFRQEHPHINVKLKPVDVHSCYFQTAGDESFDVGECDHSELPWLVKRGFLRPLNLFLRTSSLDSENFLSGPWQDCSYGRQQYLLPIGVTVPVVTYAKEASVDKPRNLDELVSLAKKLNHPAGNLPWFSTLLLAGGAKLKRDDFYFNFDLNDEIAIELMKEVMIPLQKNISFLPSGGMFKCDNFLISSSFFVLWYPNPGRGHVAPLPCNHNGLRTRVTSGLGISSKTKYPIESWQFVKFLTSEQAQRAVARFRNSYPILACEDISRDFVKSPSGDLSDLSRAIEESTSMLWPENVYSSIEKNVFQPTLANVFNGRLSPETALEYMAIEQEHFFERIEENMPNTVVLDDKKAAVI